MQTGILSLTATVKISTIAPYMYFDTYSANLATWQNVSGYSILLKFTNYADLRKEYFRFSSPPKT